MNTNKILNRPYILFFPFLLLYIAIVWVFPTNGMNGDEARYLKYAENLLKGYYSEAAPNVDISNGPGYPLLLAPFLFLKIPFVSISMVNALLHYLSIIILYKTLCKFVTSKKSFLFSLFWALNYNIYQFLPLLMTEILSAFLITLFIYSVVKVYSSKNKKETKIFIGIAGFALGYLILTKTIFFYVLLLMLIPTGLFWITNSRIFNFGKSLIVLLIALAVTVPYLVYTYSVTGRVLYVTNKGGENLYWMSTVSGGEYGDWFKQLTPEENVPAITDYLRLDDTVNKHLISYFSSNDLDYGHELKQKHQEDYSKIVKLKSLQREDFYKTRAIENIKNHPFKYFKNCIYNVGRLFFNFPYSYSLQTPRTLVRLPYNGILAFFVLISLLPTLLNWRKIPLSIQSLLFFAAFYLGGSILLSAQTRMLSIIVPILILWIAYVFDKSIKFETTFYETPK